MNDKHRVVFGIAVSPDRFDTPKGELDVWMWAPVVSEVTSVPEEEIRHTLESNFAYSEHGQQKCSVRLRSVEDAKRLTALLIDWFDRDSRRKAEPTGANA